MPKLARGLYPFRACVLWYVDYWRDRALSRQGNETKEKKQSIEAQILEGRLLEQRGHLIARAEVVMVVASAYRRLGRSLETLPGQLAKEFNWPADVQRALRDRLDDFRRTFVADNAEFVDVTDAQAPRRQKS